MYTLNIAGTTIKQETLLLKTIINKFDFLRKTVNIQ